MTTRHSLLATSERPNRHSPGLAVLFCSLLLLPSSAAAQQPATQPAKPRLTHRWVYIQTNLLVDKNVENVLALLERAAKARYTGAVFADSKFCRWGDLPDRYAANVKKVRDACTRLKLDCIPAVCPIGYSNDLLSRDVNLAEALPVKNAPFAVARDKDELVLQPADNSCTLKGGDFARENRGVPVGWNWSDEPGKIVTIDTQVRHAGKNSVRMEAASGNARLVQTLAVQPWRYYHVSVWMKAQAFKAIGSVNINVLTKDGRALNFHMPALEPTFDWRKVDITFNSLEYDQVNLYLGCWGCAGGKLWWSDVQLEPGGLVNLVRRDLAPLVATSADGKTRYLEGKDLPTIADPKMGKHSWPGDYDAWHQLPRIVLPKGTALKEGQQVLLSYYHTQLIYQDQVAACIDEPKLYELLDWQVQEVRKHLQPDGYFMSHDEIRQGGYSSGDKNTLTPGQSLAQNVGRCVKIIRTHDKGKPIYVWSDMFDPTHNARKDGWYYLVRGQGPWFGSWKGLDKDVVVVNWNSAKDKRLGSLEHFATLGHKQILAGYYDSEVSAIRGWLQDAAKVEGVVGAMYTTWRGDYSNLEKFAAELDKAE